MFGKYCPDNRDGQIGFFCMWQDVKISSPTGTDLLVLHKYALITVLHCVCFHVHSNCILTTFQLVHSVLLTTFIIISKYSFSFFINTISSKILVNVMFCQGKECTEVIYNTSTPL